MFDDSDGDLGNSANYAGEILAEAIAVAEKNTYNYNLREKVADAAKIGNFLNMVDFLSSFNIFILSLGVGGFASSYLPQAQSLTTFDTVGELFYRGRAAMNRRAMGCAP